jgi:hypothetical protein
MTLFNKAAYVLCCKFLFALLIGVSFYGCEKEELSITNLDDG